MQRDGKPVVFRLTGETVEQVPVTLGRPIGDVQEGTGGTLKSGERVVLAPDDKLAAGALVTVTTK